MTYTVSHRQAGVQRSAVAGLVRHTFRDVDKRNGVETQHSNERIVPERTHLNESWMWVNGQRIKLENSHQIIEELDRRLSTAGGTRVNKKTGKVTQIAVREDAKVVRDLVLQLDPKFTRSSEWLTEENQEERQAEMRRFTENMIEHYADLYGRHNLLAASLHLDETSPHVHLMLTPIDERGRVRQESFIKGRVAMRNNDREMRARLEHAGYDVDLEPRGGNRSNMSIDEYAQWQERIEHIEAREVEIEDREKKLNLTAKAVYEYKSKLAKEREKLDREKSTQEALEARLRGREASLDVSVAEAQKTAQTASQALREANEKEELSKQRSKEADENIRAARQAKRRYEEGLLLVERGQKDINALLKELREGTRVVVPQKKRSLGLAKQKVDQNVKDYNKWYQEDSPKKDEWEFGY